MSFKTTDIDIDFQSRSAALAVLRHIPASIIKDENIKPHNTGIYFSDIPIDPFTGQASLDYKAAEERGYFKLDFLNVSVYKDVRSEAHLNELIAKEPDWSKLKDRQFVEQLIHINNHYDTMQKMPEPVNSIVRLAMFLAIIRPAKRHLIGLPWTEVAKTIWDKVDDVYAFKKSHSIGYSHLVVVNMNLLAEKEQLFTAIVELK